MGDELCPGDVGGPLDEVLIFAPAGLDLKAETPEEIALAIVSEIQRVFARGMGESLRERRVPIHLHKARSPAEVALKWQTSVP